MSDRASAGETIGAGSDTKGAPGETTMAPRQEWVGTKGAMGVWQTIVSAMPAHRVYVEAFLGTGVIMRRKLPAQYSLGIDADPAAPGLAWLEEQDPVSFGHLVGDALKAIRSWSTRGLSRPDALLYCDPPYLFSVRSSKRRYYTHEFGEEREHRELLTLLRQLRCGVMVSGYRSDLYDVELADWRRLDVPTVNRRGTRVVESIWCNFPETQDLHDTRHVGGNFRERDRIKRRVRRWTSNFLRMPPGERAAVLAALRVAS